MPTASLGPTPVPPAVAPTGNDLCPNCNAYMARDQRYCLSCGNRRGEPRLPFMDAVAFMDASKQPPAAAAPPPPPAQRPRISNGTSLIAGVATLVLAIGVGVLIGRSGEDSAPVAAATPQVVTVETGGGGGANGGEGAATTDANKKAKGAKGNSADKAKKAGADLETGSHGGSEASEEILKPEGDVKLPPSEVQVGDPCEEGTAGCSGGKFEGDFFGE